LEESIPILPLRMLGDHLIQRALTYTRGNVSHAANMLGISWAKLYRRLRARKTDCLSSC
jgi:transcriptional regulator of acetoin/glycerol metabolism